MKKDEVHQEVSVGEDEGSFPRGQGVRAEWVGEFSGLGDFPTGHSPLRISLWKRNARKYLKERCLELSDEMGHPEWFSSVLRHLSFGVVVKMMKSPSMAFSIMEAVRVLREVVEELESLRKEGCLRSLGDGGKSRKLSSARAVPSLNSWKGGRQGRYPAGSNLPDSV